MRNIRAVGNIRAACKSASVVAAVIATLAAVCAVPGTPAANASTLNTVMVGGAVIMRVRVATSDFSVEQRTTALQERVNDLMGQGPIHPDDITVEPFGNEAVVKVKGKLLFTADWTTARYNQTTPMDLANQWADHMRVVLPRLTAAK